MRLLYPFERYGCLSLQSNNKRAQNKIPNVNHVNWTDEQILNFIDSLLKVLDKLKLNLTKKQYSSSSNAMVMVHQ